MRWLWYSNPKQSQCCDKSNSGENGKDEEKEEPGDEKNMIVLIFT